MSIIKRLLRGSAAAAGSLPKFLLGSIPFANASGDLIEDNTNLFWDNTLKKFITSDIKTGGLSAGLTLTATNLVLNANGKEHTIGVTNTVAPRTITIPSSLIAIAGKKWVIEDQSGGAAANNITIATGGAETINGGANAAITNNFGFITLYSDGSNLFIDGKTSDGSGFTGMAKSVIFLDGSGNLSEDNANIFYDSVLKEFSAKNIKNFGTISQIQSDPKIVGGIKDTVNLDGADAVFVQGKYAYVASVTADSLQIIDISVPTDPKIVGGITDIVNLNTPFGIYVSGIYVYITASSDRSLQIIDISDPTTPVFVGSVKDNTKLNGAGELYISGKYAYVASSAADSLQIIDVSDPTTPFIVGGIIDGTNLDTIVGVYVSGIYAYVACQTDDSLRIIDISDPTTPFIVGGIKDAVNLEGARDVKVSGKYAYVITAFDNSMRIIDVSDPTTPVIVGGVKDNTKLNGAFNIFVSGKYAYVTSINDDSMQIIDISDPTTPVFVGEVKDAVNLNGIRGIYVSGKFAYVVNGADDSLRIIDIGGIDSPAADIGNVRADDLTVTQNAQIGNNLHVQNALNVGPGGISSNGTSSFTSDIKVLGRIINDGTALTITSNTILNQYFNIIRVDATSNNIIITLDDLVGLIIDRNKEIIIKRIDETGNFVRIAGTDTNYEEDDSFTPLVQTVSSPASGNTLTASADVSGEVVAGDTIQVAGTDIFTVASVSTNIITTNETITTSYSADTLDIGGFFLGDSVPLESIRIDANDNNNWESI